MKANIQIFILLVFCSLIAAQDRIELSGKWQFETDPEDMGVEEKWFSKQLKDVINLPGSMAEQGKGNKISLKTKWTGDIIDSSFFTKREFENYRTPDNFKVPFWLQPVMSYYGKAWYRREVNIPSSWKDKSIKLLLERCHWQSHIWIDNVYAGNQNALGAPHIFDLAKILTPGKHYITVSVDNRINEINPGVNSSSLTDHTQTNWNGIIGEIFLEARHLIHFGNIRIFPEIVDKSWSVEMQIMNLTGKIQKINLLVTAEPAGETQKGRSSKEFQNQIELNSGENVITIRYEPADSVFLWDEFNPTLYRLKCKLNTEEFVDTREETFGFRKLGLKGTQFTINDRIIFLRGTLECAIFPKTGYPSTDVKEWTRIFRICKDYGLNHMRFHSWCPPEAAFIAADNLGMYLHVECSSWANQGVSIGSGNRLDQYIMEESERITAAFGNHPSFCFLAYGNEPDGADHKKYLTDFVAHWKKKDNRRLYSGASGWPQLEINDFHSMYEPRIQLWGAGLNSIINKQTPSSNYDWYNIINWRGKPVISHEIGQWCVYPNFREIKKYNGVLKAKNFEIFRESLTDNGMIHLADSFKNASGKLQVLCYKAEIEAALKTKGMGGFQLLDLHDFPGQGTALVGVLDPFWEEKGYVTSSEYRQFCNTTVPLLRVEKFIFNSAEDFIGSVEVSHFGPVPLKRITSEWKVIDDHGKMIMNGTLAETDIPVDNGIQLGVIRFPLSTIFSPAMYNLSVRIGEFTNTWNFWVYPYENSEEIFKENIKIVHQLNDETISYLNNGGKVLLTPRKGSIKPEKGGNIAIGFSSIFWNTAWTLGQPPHTLGILCNPKHPLLQEFPTQFHSNYQWWDAMSHSNAILLNELGSKIQPIVRIIDDWFKNRPLGLIIEAKAGNGKIIISGIDLLTDSEKRAEARQLTHSIVKYMSSELFNPVQEISIERIKGLFTNEDFNMTEIKEGLHAGAVEIEKVIKEYYPEKDPLVIKKLEEWQDLKFGLLMHWAPSSQWGVVESWSICSEDEPWCRRNIEDYTEYKKKYEDLKKTFNPAKFNPENWANAAFNAGMKYVIFTTKHHDGFCMYDTKFTDYKITDPECPFHNNPRANIAKEIFNAFREKGFWTGAYFSKPDWHSDYFWWQRFATPDRNANYDIDKYPERWQNFVQFTHNQINELVSDYGRIDILWFDGGWVRSYTEEQIQEERKTASNNIHRLQNQDIKMPLIAKNARKKQPGIIVVDRAVPGPYQNYLTPENQVPDSTLSYPWETCMPMSSSWSYSPGAEYKSARKLIHLLADIVAKGGNFLLNIGPTPEGEYDETAFQRLNEIGEWMKVNSEAIYKSRPIKPYKAGKICFTQLKDGTVYCIYLADENEKIVPEKFITPKFNLQPDSFIELIGSNEKLSWTITDSNIIIKIPETVRNNPPCNYAWTIKITSNK